MPHHGHPSEVAEDADAPFTPTFKAKIEHAHGLEPPPIERQEACCSPVEEEHEERERGHVKRRVCFDDEECPAMLPPEWWSTPLPPRRDSLVDALPTILVGVFCAFALGTATGSFMSMASAGPVSEAAAAVA